MNGFVYSLRYLLNISIVFSLTFGSLVRAEAPGDQSQRSDEALGSLVVKNVNPKLPDLKIDIQTKTLEAADEPAELARAIAGSGDAEQIIVSTDEVDVLSQAAKGADSRMVLLPFGKAIQKSADMVGGVNSAIRGSGSYLKQAFKKDWIGFSIATFTLGTEIYKWIHISTASNFMITSNIVYSILWSAIFVDKDTWSNTTKPLQRTFRKLFGLSQVVPEHPTIQDTAMKFLAGLSLSLILNSGRAAIVGIDQLSKHVFDAMSLSMPYVMGAVMTAVGFSWSELVGHIDETKTPRAKRATRLVMNARSVIVAWFAASAMLMHPEEYGIRPWLTVAVSGAIGLILYSTSKTWIQRVDTFFAPRCERLFTEPAFSH